MKSRHIKFTTDIMFMKIGLSMQEGLSENPDTQSIRHTHALCKFNTSGKTKKEASVYPGNP